MTMNIFQTLNTAVFAGTILALIAGLAKIPIPITQRPLTLWLFVAFFVLFRLKVFLDDYKYYATADTKNVHFKIGFIIGFVSWLIWAFGAWSVPVLPDSYFLVGIAITISTIWIIVVAMRVGAYREQYIWMATNSLFVIILWVTYRRNMPDGDWATWTALGIGLGLIILDFVLSKSIPEK